MRSRQLNFFILPEEWKDINQFLLLNDIAIIKQPIRDPEQLFSKDIFEKNNGELDTIYFTNQKFNKAINVKFIENQNYYLVDNIRSCVLEFDRGGFYATNPERLHRARLYFVASYYNGMGEVIAKDKDFVTWAAKFIRSFKAKYLLNKIDDFWVSDGVMKWMKNNEKNIAQSGLYIE